MIVPGKKYSVEEIAILRRQYPDLRVPGMVTRANLDGTTQFVPWHQASGGGRLHYGEQELPDRAFASSLDDPFGELRRIERRPPRVQLASLMEKVRPDFMAGKVMPASEVATYVRDKKRARQLRAGAGLTEDDFAQVMKAFIKRAEDENEIAEAKKTVRTAPSD